MAGPLADPRAAYAGADVVIGMGGSAARGLAFGKPLVVQGEFGDFRLFDPLSAGGLFRSSFWNEDLAADPVRQLVDILQPLLQQPELRTALGRYGRSFAESNFGLDAMAKRLAAIYEAAPAHYSPVSWLYDQRLEARWALGWITRHVVPHGGISKRLSYAQEVARHEAASAEAGSAAQTRLRPVPRP